MKNLSLTIIFYVLMISISLAIPPKTIELKGHLTGSEVINNPSAGTSISITRCAPPFDQICIRVIVYPKNERPLPQETIDFSNLLETNEFLEIQAGSNIVQSGYFMNYQNQMAPGFDILTRNHIFFLSSTPIVE